MNYRIIQDEEKLKEFIEWLPELQSSEKYYISLLARNKYLQDKTLLKSDKIALKRFVSDKNFLYRKIKQLQVEIGAYTHDDSPIPPESLALYITPNPRDLEKATKASLIRFAELITKPYNGYNPHSETLSCIQKSCSRKIFYDIDVDGELISDFVYYIDGKINLDCLTIVKTRGGFHCLLEFGKMEKQYEKTWYKSLCSFPGVDVRGSNGLLPVVGCLQGDFVPHFVKI